MQVKILGEVQGELAGAMAAHDDLCNKAHGSIGQVTTKMLELEARIGMIEVKGVKVPGEGKGGRVSRSLVHPKSMLPEKLEKQVSWRQWRSDVEDYCEEKFQRMKDIIQKARREDRSVKEWFFVDMGKD